MDYGLHRGGRSRPPMPPKNQILLNRNRKNKNLLKDPQHLFQFPFRLEPYIPCVVELVFRWDSSQQTPAQLAATSS